MAAGSIWILKVSVFEINKKITWHGVGTSHQQGNESKLKSQTVFADAKWLKTYLDSLILNPSLQVLIAIHWTESEVVHSSSDNFLKSFLEVKLNKFGIVDT